MKCVICKSTNIIKKSVEEEIKIGHDIVLFVLDTFVCQSCGERYYDRKTMQKLEDVKVRLSKEDVELEDVGRVLRAKVA
jgi:YgiT-type zinc finger domain-containing protein